MIWKLFFILCLISKQAFRNTISVQVDLSGMSQLAFRCHRFTWTNILSKRNWLAPKVLSDQRWHCQVEYHMYYQVHCRGEICHCRHCRRQCKIFASGVNFSRNNAICYINESKKVLFILISSLKLSTYY